MGTAFRHGRRRAAAKVAHRSVLPTNSVGCPKIQGDAAFFGQSPARLILCDRLVIAEEVDARPIVRAWLTSILRRVCTEVRRTEVAAKRIRDAMAEEVRPPPDPMSRLISREELAQVPRGLRALDLVTLDAFLRHGCNYASTAAALRIPIGSLSTRITEIRRYIRRRRDLDK